MINNEVCIHGGVSPKRLLTNLHRNQGGPGRHKCPTCAYEQGFFLGSSKKWSSYTAYCNNLERFNQCGRGSIAPIDILSRLDENQGGTGRHKCTNCAFKQGFEEGLLGVTGGVIALELVAAPDIDNLNMRSSYIPTVIDYARIEADNKQLGLLGEIFILRNEVAYLHNQGRSDLAEQVQHVSVELGDGLGYDILSFDIHGNKKRIEVKTTRGGIMRPFYLTRNELDTSSQYPDSYFLYRLFDFNSKENRGQYYAVRGNLNESLKLDSVLYIAIPKPKNS